MRTTRGKPNNNNALPRPPSSIVAPVQLPSTPTMAPVRIDASIHRSKEMTPKRRLGHCVLFLQTSADTSTRTWNDFETAAQAIEWLLARFEHKLKAVAATTPAIQYEMPAIFKFVDSLSDVAMFVSIEGSSIALSEDGAPIYAPKGREWIKTQIVHLLDGDPVRL